MGVIKMKQLLFVIVILLLFQCSTGPEFVDLSGEAEAPESSSSSSIVHYSFGGWCGTAASEHFVMKEFSPVPLMPVDVGGDIFSLSPQTGFSAYLQ